VLYQHQKEGDPAVVAGELDTGLIERRGSPALPIGCS